MGTIKEFKLFLANITSHSLPITTRIRIDAAGCWQDDYKQVLVRFPRYY